MDKAAAIKTAKQILIDCGFGLAVLAIALIVFLPDPYWLLGPLLSFSVVICFLIDGVKTVYRNNKRTP